MTADTADQASPEEAGFQLLADQLPNLIILALDTVAHFGLIAMREQVEALNGRVRVVTTPGEGTVIEAKLPLTDPERWEP